MSASAGTSSSAHQRHAAGIFDAGTERATAQHDVFPPHTRIPA